MSRPLVLIPATLFGDIGLIAAILGFCGLAIGLVDLFGLPKALDLSH